MTITFNTNISALGTQRYLGIASDNTASSLAKLSSGSRVPSAKDDAAALAVGTQLKAEVAGLNQASLNASQAGSVLQIADGALSTLSDILTRMKSLAIQSSSGQLSDADRGLLNSEYTSLQSEVDRIAGITNFNGKNLLAGSTAVTASANGLASFTANNDTSYSSLLDSAHGFSGITFGDNFGDGAVKITYDSTGTNQGNLTVKNLVTGVSQTIGVASGAIAAGSTEELSFNNLGVKVTLNSNFNKSADLASTNTAKVTANPSFTAYTATATGNAGALTITAASTGVTAIAFNDTNAGTFGNSRLFGSDLTGRTLTVNGSSTKTAVTFNDLVFSVNGVQHTFKQTNAAQDFSTSTTNRSFNFDDGQGNTFTLQVAVNAAATANGDVTGLQVAFTAGTTGGLIENTGNQTLSTSPTITAVSEATSGTGAANTTNFAYNFGQINNSRLTVDASTASASVLTLVVTDADGTTHTFTNSNTTGGGTAADLTSTGTKTVTLADSNVSTAAANRITVQFNVTQAFVNGGVASIGLGDAGQLAGADSITSGSTAFSFKVGTGTTSNDSVSFTLSSATQTALGINGTSIGSQTNANTAITAVTTAITTVSTARANIGASQSRLAFAKSSVDVAIQNTTAAQSGLLDVDVSAEITKFSSQQVLLQAGVSLLAQANQQPALLLRLLQ